MIKRETYLKKITEIFSYFPVCAVIGARQVGKTTLALEFAKDFEKYHHFDLEDPTDALKLSEAKLLFSNLTGLIIIDEIQRMPELFPFLRVIADSRADIKILILGSSSREVLEKSNESLAGRVSYIELPTLRNFEVHESTKLWIRGGFPKAFLAPNDYLAFLWIKNYTTSFIERDLRAIGFDLDPQATRKLLVILAQSHGSTVNYSDISKSIGLSDVSVKKYINILENAFVITVLKPWFENISKRQIKAPKIYIKDSGILHYLLGINEQIILHPKCGSSWEGFAIEEVMSTFDPDRNSSYFWRTNAGAELDLLIVNNGQKIGFEIKYTSIPKITTSMRSSIIDLNLDKLFVIVPNKENFPLSENIQVVGLDNIVDCQHFTT